MYFRRHDRELVLKPAVSLKKSWGGYRSKTLDRNSYQVVISVGVPRYRSLGLMAHFSPTRGAHFLPIRVRIASF